MMRPSTEVHASRPRFAWVAYAACVIAFAALASAVIYGFNPHGSQNAASDFKTLYASAWCFRHGIDAYQFGNLAEVFRMNGVVEPRSWYGHSPVYPPLTLLLLAPFTWLGMVPAIYLWIVLGTLSMACATAALVHAASRAFGLSTLLQVVLVGLAAASPLLEIGLELANVSVGSTALSVFAVAAPRTLSPTWSPWLRALALTVALLLKPHIAFWVVVAFLFSGAQEDRAVFWRTCGLTAAFMILFAAWGAVHHFAFAQFGSYRSIVLSELGSGSMSPGNRDVMEVFVQITSLSSLLGYWLWQNPVLGMLNAAFLLGVGGTLAWVSWRLRSAAERRLVEGAAAWCAFGLMATYHRDADAMVLMLVLPILLARLRRNVNDAWAWCLLAMLIAGALGPSAADLHLFTDPAPPSSVSRFVLLRQASLAAAALTLLLVGQGAILAGRRSQALPGPEGV